MTFVVVGNGERYELRGGAGFPTAGPFRSRAARARAGHTGAGVAP